jgi:hypothetical protein
MTRRRVSLVTLLIVVLFASLGEAHGVSGKDAVYLQG